MVRHSLFGAGEAEFAEDTEVSAPVARCVGTAQAE